MSELFIAFLLHNFYISSGDFNISSNIKMAVLYRYKFPRSSRQENVNIIFIGGSKNHSAVIAHMCYCIPSIF